MQNLRKSHVALLISVLAVSTTVAQDLPKDYVALCAGCHGERANGAERGPALVDNRRLRSRTLKQIYDTIHNGTTGGMPPFALAEPRLRTLAEWVHSLNASAFDSKLAGDADAGKRFFLGKGKCNSCHMISGSGGTNGPDLSSIGRQLTGGQLSRALVDPVARSSTRSTASCPGWAWCPDDTWAVVNVQLNSGKTLRGFARNRGKHDIQLQTFDGIFHLLRDTQYKQVVREAASIMPPLEANADEHRDLIAYLSRMGGVPVGPMRSEVVDAFQKDTWKPGDWPTYNGDLSSNRHSNLDQINTSNAGGLQLQWSYSLPHESLQTTPIVADGVMYVTGPNRVCALDGQTGRQIWCYSRERTPAGGISGDAAKGANRGAALSGDRVLFATDNAHLICLNRVTGALMWDVPVADTPAHYGSTAAPLVVGDLVVTGVGGGDEGIRGFLAAFKVTTGELAWRFWTVPKQGEPGSETWSGKAIEVGGAATWLTGSYDSATNMLYWPTGNPFPDTNGEDRKGDNLYTNSVVALDAATGKLRWHFQFTPHDLHDWDATEPLVLVNAPFQGRDRKLLLQANRNGFYYVLDRTSGQFLAGHPFVKRLTWASGIGKDGRPILLEGNTPSKAGTVTCPAVRGATNWYSTAFNPTTKLFYVMAVEDCNLYQQSQLGGYVPFRDPKSPPEKYLRALNVETGKIAWEIPQVGPPESNYSGVLSTAGGLVFYGETGGGFAAVNAKTGTTLWHFELNDEWKASPMTYQTNGRQFVAIASGGKIVSFALPEK